MVRVGASGTGVGASLGVAMCCCTLGDGVPLGFILGIGSTCGGAMGGPGAGDTTVDPLVNPRGGDITLRLGGVLYSDPAGGGVWTLTLGSNTVP